MGVWTDLSQFSGIPWGGPAIYLILMQSGYVLDGQVPPPPNSNFKLWKKGTNSSELASHNLLHFSTFIWLQQFSVTTAFTLPKGN